MTVHDIQIRKCAWCGNEFGVSHPDLWAYKQICGKKTTYWCSWSCLRKTEREGKPEMGKLTLDNKKEAVRIALEGGSPVNYLSECGAPNPAASWAYIKKCLQKKDPDTYMKLPEKYRPATVSVAETPEVSLADAMAGMKDAADTFFGKCQDMGLKIETPEKDVAVIDHYVPLPQITKCVCYDGMKVREVEGEFGRYRYASSSGTEYIDFENADKLETISLTVDQWRTFRAEQVKAAAILGVEL